MKKIITGLFLIVSFCSQSQLVDSSYTNIFSHISDYRNYNEVYLGNIGQAKFNLFSPFDDNNSQVKSLFPKGNNKKTYTDVFYTLGSGNENYFDLEHHQKLSKNLFGYVRLLKTNSTGIYIQQMAALSNLEIALSYMPKNKRYNFEANFKNYKRSNEINGGVADSSFFALQDSSNTNVKTTYPVQLHSAVASISNALEIKRLDMNYRHSYSLSKLKNDSIGYFQLSQVFGYQRTKQNFDIFQHNGFFTNYNYDTVGTQDSLKLEQLSHEIGLDYIKNSTKLSAGIGQNYYEYISYSPFKVHFENYVYGRLHRKKNKLELNSDANFLISDGSYESFGLKNRLCYSDSSLPVFNQYIANLNLGTNQPELFYDNYISNHYQWNRMNAKNTIIKANMVGLNSKLKTSVGLDFESQSNTVFWDTASQIDQTAISVLGITLQKEFRFTKSFVFSTFIRVQDVLETNSIELPNLFTFNKLYFKGKIFKKQLSFDAGINLLYYSSFYARAYNPALDKFYVQDKQKVGNYPMLDIFAEFYLKNSFSFFVTLTHVNSGLLKEQIGNNYLATTNYPRQDRAFKFGLKWRLFD